MGKIYYYFADELDMNQERARKRDKNTRFTCRAYLKNYNFVHDGCSSSRKGAYCEYYSKRRKYCMG